jgi:NAD(P)-dependent dehydrogenase (short-subunit alcohol dehydrogenase family)
MDLQLKGKTAFISGSGMGIGFAMAKQLLLEGAAVVINSLTKQEVDNAIEQLKAEVPDANVSGFAANFSDVNEINAMLEKLPEIDILINNAGIFEEIDFVDITDEKWLRYYEINVLSGVRLSRFLLPKMIARNWGRIIFTTSEAAATVPPNMIHYSMTKTALHAVSRGLAELTKGTNVTVNTVMPGPTASNGVKAYMEEHAKKAGITVAEAETDFFRTVRPTSLIQRFIDPVEIANLVTYLSSPLASATNGAPVRADGGVNRSVL